MKLIIVESPTKAKTLSRFLGDDYLVEATLGHIKDLPKSPISVDIEKNFEPDYQVVARQKKTISALKKAGKKASEIYLATDPDREGEAIAAHAAELFADDKKVLKRITFHEITKSAVEEAIAHPSEIDKKLVDAQIARRVLDRLVGYKLSPVLWKKVRRGLSAGRVQTVAVRLIVEREDEITAFKPQEYWEIASVVAKGESGEFVINLQKVDGKKAQVATSTSAKQIVTDLEKADYEVAGVTKREVKKAPYPPFTTSTLTQAAANLFGWSAKKTMSVAQKLYEEGHITYHRTDSLSVAKQAVDRLWKFVTEQFGAEYLVGKPRFYKTNSKSAQEAHEAIRPTTLETQKVEISSETNKLYELIWKRFVATQMAESVSDSTTIDVTATAGTTDYLLRATGSIMKFPGWRKIIPASKKEDPQLPDVAQGDALSLIKVTSEQKFTLPPARYNEASLIKKLEELGIGRPSTYAPTISTIQVRQYVEKKDRAFYATPVGIATTKFLLPNFPDITDYSFTAGMEESLDKVAEGKLDWHKEIANFWGPFEKKLAKVEKAKRVQIPTEKLGKKCPTCAVEGRAGDAQGELVVRTGRFGKFVSCSLFPECKHTEKYLDKIGMKCPTCDAEGRTGDKQGDIIVKKTGKGRKFYGCSNYPDCKFASWKDPKVKKA